MQVQAVARLLAHRKNEAEYPAAGIVLIAVALGRTLVSESALGLTVGHKEALAIIERMMKNFRAESTATVRSAK
jgi:predicted GNAT family N-acyltransferase